VLLDFADKRLRFQKHVIYPIFGTDSLISSQSRFTVPTQPQPFDRPKGPEGLKMTNRIAIQVVVDILSIHLLHIVDYSRLKRPS
jgi:hypothetical protein